VKVKMEIEAGRREREETEKKRDLSTGDQQKRMKREQERVGRAKGGGRPGLTGWDI